MASKGEEENKVMVLRLLLTYLEEVRRIQDCLKQIALKKEINSQNNTADFESIESILSSNLYNVKVELG